MPAGLSEEAMLAEITRRGLGLSAPAAGGALAAASKALPRRPPGQEGRLSAPEHYEDAVRYALGIPGLSGAIMGVKSAAELQKAVDTVKRYRPFTPEELTRLEETGKRIAAQWGELRGPVAAD